MEGLNKMEVREMERAKDFWEEAEVISVYTRRQAIEDGVLVDLTQPELLNLVKEAGFKYPVAMTTEAFMDCVALTPAAKRAGNDIKGRLWDVLWMLRTTIREARGEGGNITMFKLLCITDRRRLCTLKAICGPGDDGEPVITIMHPWQD